MLEVKIAVRKAVNQAVNYDENGNKYDDSVKRMKCHVIHGEACIKLLGMTYDIYKCARSLHTEK